MNEHATSRRAFLETAGHTLGGLWLAVHWRAVEAAAHHADAVATSAAAADFTWLTAAEAADVDALCACIVPSGETLGAHEARVVVFIDRALGSFFADRSDEFRQGLNTVRATFAMDHAGKSFAQSGMDEQIAFMRTIDTAAFFGQLRFLTIFGLLASPKYGGNAQGAGWRMLGFADQHIFSPPFGYYDRDYPGFKPYAPMHPLSEVPERSK